MFPDLEIPLWLLIVLQHFLNNSRASDNSIKYPMLHAMSGKIKTFPQFVEKHILYWTNPDV